MSTTYKKIFNTHLKKFPCILIAGPKFYGRQDAITDLLPNDHIKFSLGSPEVRAKAIRYPQEIFDTKAKVILLEDIQYAPSLAKHIRDHINKNQSMNQKFVLTSSFAIQELKEITKNLSSKFSILHIKPGYLIDANNSTSKGIVSFPDKKSKPISKSDILKSFLYGYSRVNKNKHTKSSQAWYDTWLTTYIEREVRAIRNIENITDFQIFLKRIASQNDTTLNMAEIARELNVSLNTIKAWMTILANSFVVNLIKPYRLNYGIRCKRTPHLYFNDTGLISYLTGIKKVSDLEKSEHLISMLKSVAINEIYRWYFNRGDFPIFSMWSPSNQEDSCILLESGDKIYAFDFSIRAKTNIKEFKFHQQLMNIFGNSIILHNIHLEDDYHKIADNCFSSPIQWMLKW
ncbi:MAG: hypothetical protein COA79_16190 [Planctomycetota bacterium]|nr:MAG: hypothetical protein COA79_16190 [Planctomycetota bacterium]